jgi:tetratricopeptide (TPR) repeat protein
MAIDVKTVEDLGRELDQSTGQVFAVVHGTDRDLMHLTRRNPDVMYVPLTGFGSFRLPFHRSLLAFYGASLGFDTGRNPLSPLDGLAASGFVSAAPTRITGHSIITRLMAIHKDCRAIIVEAFCSSLTVDDVDIVQVFVAQALAANIPIYLWIREHTPLPTVLDDSAIYLYLAGGKLRQSVLDCLTGGNWDPETVTLRHIRGETWTFPTNERLMRAASDVFHRRDRQAQRNLISRLLHECPSSLDYRWEALVVEVADEDVVLSSYSATTVRSLLGTPEAQTPFFRCWRRRAKHWSSYGAIRLNYLAFMMMTNQRVAIRILRMGLKNDRLLRSLERVLPDAHDRAQWLFALYQYGAKFGSRSVDLDLLEKLFHVCWSLTQTIAEDEVQATSHQAALLNARALLWVTRGNIRLAINDELEAHQSITCLGDAIPQIQRVLILKHLGDLFRQQRNLQAARSYYEEAVDRALTSGDEKAIKYVAMKYLAIGQSSSRKAKSIENSLIDLVNQTDDAAFVERVVRWGESQKGRPAKSPSALWSHAKERLKDLSRETSLTSNLVPTINDILALLPCVSGEPT